MNQGKVRQAAVEQSESAVPRQATAIHIQVERRMNTPAIIGISEGRPKGAMATVAPMASHHIQEQVAKNVRADRRIRRPVKP